MEESIFDCSICADKLDDAMETKCCHHCFCKRCIEEWLQLQKSCPSCRKALTTLDLVPNVPIQRMINNLPVECPNSKLGCTAKLTRGILKEHVQSSCEFVEVLCANQCGIKVLKRDQLSHQRESCSRRLMPCIQCSLAIPLDVILEHMSTQCMKGQVLCSHCKALPLRENLHRHHQYECLKITLTCPFAQFGCQFKGLRPEYNKHMIEDSDLHVGVVIERESRMSEEIARLKNELERTKGNQQSRNKFGFEENPFSFTFDFNQQPKADPFRLNELPQNNFEFKVPEPKPVPNFSFAAPPSNSFAVNAQPNEPQQSFWFGSSLVSAPNQSQQSRNGGRGFEFKPPQYNSNNGFSFGNALPANNNAPPFSFSFEPPKNDNEEEQSRTLVVARRAKK